MKNRHSTSRCATRSSKRGASWTTKGLSEDAAISLISVAVDFGVTQVVDGNWGVHAIIRKALFNS
jgi:acetamidase/formamidase